MINNVVKFIKKADRHGISQNIKIDSEDNYKTLFGGLMFIVLKSLMLLTVFYFGRELWEKKQPLITSSTEEFGTVGPFHLSEKEFYVFIGIEDPQYNYYFDNSVVSLSAIEIEMKTNNNTQTQTVRELEIKQCSSYFNDTNKYEFDKSNLDMNLFYCIKPNTTFLQNYWGAEYYRFVKIFINKCTNNTNTSNNNANVNNINSNGKSNDFCSTSEKISSLTEGGIFTIYTYDYYTQLKNYTNPLQLYLADIFTSMSSNFYLGYYLAMTPLELVEDNNVFFDESKSTKKYTHMEPNIMYFGAKEVGLAEIILQTKNVGTKVTRSYDKFQDILIKIGGLLEVVEIIGAIFAKYISTIEFINDSLFNINYKRHLYKYKDKTIAKDNIEKNLRNNLSLNNSFTKEEDIKRKICLMNNVSEMKEVVRKKSNSVFDDSIELIYATIRNQKKSSGNANNNSNRGVYYNKEDRNNDFSFDESKHYNDENNYNINQDKENISKDLIDVNDNCSDANNPTFKLVNKLENLKEKTHNIKMNSSKVNNNINFGIDKLTNTVESSIKKNNNIHNVYRRSSYLLNKRLSEGNITVKYKTIETNEKNIKNIDNEVFLKKQSKNKEIEHLNNKSSLDNSISRDSDISNNEIQTLQYNSSLKNNNRINNMNTRLNNKQHIINSSLNTNLNNNNNITKQTTLFKRAITKENNSENPSFLMRSLKRLNTIFTSAKKKIRFADNTSPIKIKANNNNSLNIKHRHNTFEIKKNKNNINEFSRDNTDFGFIRKSPTAAILRNNFLNTNCLHSNININKKDSHNMHDLNSINNLDTIRKQEKIDISRISAKIIIDKEKKEEISLDSTNRYYPLLLQVKHFLNYFLDTFFCSFDKTHSKQRKAFESKLNHALSLNTIMEKFFILEVLKSILLSHSTEHQNQIEEIYLNTLLISDIGNNGKNNGEIFDLHYSKRKLESLTNLRRLNSSIKNGKI